MNTLEYEAVIGLEVHAELETRSKMFCSCARLDSSVAQPNRAVCPVCAGMPGVLPVVNRRAVEYALRVALALECEVNHTSLFVRKNYFYPDLPKGYQISQYEQPLARNGRLTILTSQGERLVRVRRVHLEEDTGKLTHVQRDHGLTDGHHDLANGQTGAGGQNYSLVDLNRAGVPLLEIVSEPDLHTPEEVRAYAQALRSLLRYLGVNSGDMQKGVLRIEPNISVRPAGSQGFGTRSEIKNLNSFRALERSVAYEIQRQGELLRQGQPVVQETRGWDEGQGITVPQRSKEEAEDYRYFPEPDLPPLVIEQSWIDEVLGSLPELPNARFHRLQAQYGLGAYDAAVLTDERQVADFFEATLAALAALAAAPDAPGAPPKVIANWISGELFSLLNQAGIGIEASRVSPQALAVLVSMIGRGEINQNTGKTVLVEAFHTGKSPQDIVAERGLRQISDASAIAGLVQRVLADNPEQVAAYLGGKDNLARWLFGQVARLAGGQANPQMVQQELERQLNDLKRHL
jgi:aspartyl-tRNA(Asn)/glutamyl-tRNA(Gln) amidotransferase subunit B